MVLSPQALSKITQGSVLTNFMPYLEAELGAMESAITNRILTLVNSNELTPDVAYQSWLEVANLRKLRQRFQQRARIGEAVGQKSLKDLEIADRDYQLQGNWR